MPLLSFEASTPFYTLNGEKNDQKSPLYYDSRRYGVFFGRFVRL